MNRTLFPHFFAFLLTGGLLAFPGACLDLLLRDFHWTPALFGVAMMLQGGSSFVGSRFASRRCGGDRYRSWVAWSLCFLASGVVFYYFADWTLFPVLSGVGMPAEVVFWSRLLGICLIGFGIGCNGILNNAAALVSEKPSFGLNLLNMGFTAGAVLLPSTASQFLKWTGLTEGALAWRWPAGGLVFCYLLLTLHVLRSPHVAQPPPVQPKSDDASRGSFPFPVWAACLVLFCYVGSEINLSNSLGLMSELMFGFSNADARLASSFFWGGLLAVRLYFCFRSPPASSYPRVMMVLSSLCVVLFAALLLRFFAEGRHALLVSRIVILSLGACIGGMYSLTLGSLTALFESHESRRFANITVLSGVAGAVLLPFTFGQFTNLFGLVNATSFILVLLCGMLTGAALLFFTSRAHAKGQAAGSI
jgi:fucose permease